MTYAPYLIANFATGLDKSLQPWLVPDDAQEALYDGYVYRGTMSKREGYQYFAVGMQGGASYRESRIVYTLSSQSMTGSINGTNQLFTSAGSAQLARGSVTITGSNPSQSFTDNGIGQFMNGPSVIGSVDYIAGAISITLPVAPTSGTVLVTYSYMPGNPVMMIANFVTATNAKELIVADTQYTNKYNPVTNILEYLPSATSPYTGGKSDFFTWVNYKSGDDVPRLLFCNNVNVIQQYDGSSVTNYTYNMLTSTSSPVAVTTLWCSFMVEMKDRLLLLRTTENGTIYPQRIRISGTGANSDDFRTSATGAGFIDIPDGTWIKGAAFNRDDLIIFTERSTWTLKYTGNDTTPFALDKIDESRGSDATFACITYLNRTSAASKRGLIISDGYRVERQDINIPSFSYNEIDNANFDLCFAGSVDADRDHYLIYPTQGQTAGEETSKNILVTNYEEDNYSIYRLPISCMGNYLTSFETKWSDLVRPLYKNWNQLSVSFGNWNSFAYSKGVPFTIGGGHKGEIWTLSVTEAEDNKVLVRNITVIDDFTLQVTTDWNNFKINSGSDEDEDDPDAADYISFYGIEGMEEINQHQFQITEIINNNTFNVDISTLGILSSELTPYTTGGSAQRVIPFSSLFKTFNPFVNMDRKVRCGWVYMYVDTTGTELIRNEKIANITQSEICVVETVDNHNFQTGQEVSFILINGMTELNNNQYYITVLSPTTFSLNDVDSTLFSAYISGGYVGVEDPAKILIDVIANDADESTQVNNQSPNPYQGNCTNITFQTGSKKWYKVFINQTGKFLQFRFRNKQSGATINIQATMFGFQPVGRLI